MRSSIQNPDSSKVCTDVKSLDEINNIGSRTFSLRLELGFYIEMLYWAKTWAMTGNYWTLEMYMISIYTGVL